MRRRALLVSTADPFPVVTNGCARLVSDYQGGMFPDHDVSFLLMQPGSWTPADPAVDVDALLTAGFEFVLFIGFKENDVTRVLANGLPSFCLTDRFPHPDVPARLFNGVLTHRNDLHTESPDVLLVGGTFDDSVFCPTRHTSKDMVTSNDVVISNDIVVSVGRIHPDKRQLDLVASYREQVFEPYGFPLHLIGGVDDTAYWERVAEYVDGESVVLDGWRSAGEVAAFCNRARLFVSASPQESFGMALIEAMACGTTCIVNGTYTGFAEAELGPHVHGSVTGVDGSTVELVAKALADDVRIDGSAWAMQYSLSRTRPRVARFIDARL
jgi:glycosyltransferase involved in cell wall biosynthesis